MLIAKPSACFRHLALVLDSDCLADWCSGQVGHSHFSCAVQIPPFQKGVCLVTAHLPHQGRPLDDFLAALSSLEACLIPMVRKNHPIILLGDLNVDLCQGSGARLTALLACFHKLGLLHFSKDSAPTWGTHRLDHLVCNSLVIDTCQVFPCQPACPWAAVEVRPDLKHALSVDHNFVLHELLTVGRGRRSRGHRFQRYRAFLHRPCKMHVTNVPLLQQKIYGFLDFASRGLMPAPQSFLTECAVQCCSRAPALRFRDSPELQQLCRARSVCGDAQQRRVLSLSIHVRRKWEKQMWRRHLLHRASRGYWSARRFLQRKSGSSSSRVASGLVRQFGSRDAAIAHVKDIQGSF